MADRQVVLMKSHFYTTCPVSDFAYLLDNLFWRDYFGGGCNGVNTEGVQKFAVFGGDGRLSFYCDILPNGINRVSYQGDFDVKINWLGAVTNELDKLGWGVYVDG